jgi:hypothetical protein
MDAARLVMAAVRKTCPGLCAAIAAGGELDAADRAEMLEAMASALAGQSTAFGGDDDVDA